jgi:membrane protein
VGALILIMLLLSAYYAIGPRRERFVWRWITPGCVVATVGWLLASLGFSVYLNRFGHETRSYGTFADVAVLLLWLYLTGLAVLVGAEVNCEVERPPTPADPPPPQDLGSGP